MSSSKKDSPQLRILSESFRGTIIPLEGNTIGCGRKPDCDIQIPHRTVSSHHCEFRLTEDGVYAIHDLGSTNGIRVNNVPAIEQSLVNGDILQIGKIEVRYETKSSSITNTIPNQLRTHIDLSPEQTGRMLMPMEPSSPLSRREHPHVGLVLKLVLVVLVVAALLLTTKMVCVMMEDRMDTASAVGNQVTSTKSP